MPREVFNQLSAIQVKRLKEPGKYADGFGLYLYINNGGGKSWVWRGLVNGKRREIGMGSAYIVPISDAREVSDVSACGT